MKIFTNLLIFIAACTMLFAQTTSVVFDEIPDGSPMYYFHGKKVARSTDGTLMIVFQYNSQINYTIYDASFDTWSPPAAVSAAGDEADKCAVAADNSGNFHLVWQERPTGDDNYIIMYSKYNGSSWSSPVKISLHDANECEEASITVDSEENIWVAYNNDGAGEPDEFVYVVNSTDGGATWSSTAEAISSSGYIGSSITNGRCTIAAGPDGKLTAVWHNGTDYDSGRREIFVNTYDGSAWTGEVMVSDTTSKDREANWYPTAAMDNDANIYLVYHTNNVSSDTLNRRYLLLQKKGWEESWDQSVTSVIHTETANDMLSTSATCDENNVLHLIYRIDVPEDTTGIDAIVYQYTANGGETWSEQMIVSRTNHDAGYATIGARVRTEYGVDITFRESFSEFVGDQDTSAIIYVNIPYDIIDDVEQADLPTSFELIRNYPNPFNPTTTFVFNIVKPGSVSLKIYDILGNEVKTLISNEMFAGQHEITWDGTNNQNQLVTSGIYLARLETLKGRNTIKVQLLK